MDQEQKENLTRLVNELDQAVPRDGAAVRMFVSGGGPDESRMVGSEVGYLRLGIEILKGTLNPFAEVRGNPPLLDIDLEYLETEDSDVHFNQFMFDHSLRKEAAAPKLSRSAKAKDRVAIFLVTAFMMFLLAAFVVGVVTIIGWTIGLFKPL